VECAELLLPLQQSGCDYVGEGNRLKGVQDIQDGAGINEKCAFQKRVAILPVILSDDPHYTLSIRYKQ
jgi:hypothetical protein